MAAVSAPPHAANGSVFPGGAHAHAHHQQHAAGFPSDRRTHHVSIGGFLVEVWNGAELDIVRALGKGGFGAVALARRRSTGEVVAFKSPAPSARAKKPYAAAAATGEILTEAGFLAACGGHPSIVALKAVAVHPRSGELCGLVMEHAGTSLHDVIHHHRLHGASLPEEYVRRVVSQLLHGAKHMHARHIVHRDIKPKNILVGEMGYDTKICDLGLAMSMKNPPPYGFAGTPAYMAPEMLLGKSDYDGLVDLWSIGCVMAELLHGKPLFNAQDECDVMCSIFHVLGVPSYASWPGYASLPLAGQVWAMVSGFRKRSRLREIFPETILSKDGFNVLKRLLSCNPKKRISASLALRQPWFSHG